MTRHTLHIAPNHPAFAGHFPGAPILPGVVLLDAAVHAAAAAAPASSWEIASAKFHDIVQPGAVLTLEQEMLPNGAVRFSVSERERLIASGTLKPRAERCDVE